MIYEGIVIKMTKNKAIVTTEDFECFYIKRTPTTYVGKRVVFTNKDIVNKTYIASKLILIAACFFLIFALGLRLNGMLNFRDAFSHNKTFAYIGVDINPSVDMEIDESGLVLKVIPLNEDGESIAKNLNVEKVEVSKVIDEMIDVAKSNGAVFEIGKEYILISSTLNSNRTEQDKEYQADKNKLDSILDSVKDNIQKSEKVNIYVVQASKSERKEAQDKGISAGRYKLFNELKEDIQNFSIEEAKNVSVNELIKLKMYQEEKDNLSTTPIPTASPNNVEIAEPTISPTPTDYQEDIIETPTPIPTPTMTPVSLQTLIPTPIITPTPMPTPKPIQTSTPTPNIRPTPTATQVVIPTMMPIPTMAINPGIPMPIPTMPFMPQIPGGQTSNAAYRIFEACNYPGQYIQHKIHYEAYISANGILPGDNVFKVVPGLADSSCISLESINFPGQYLKVENFRIVLKPVDGSNDFNENATFRKVPGLADQSLISLESYAYPNKYIRHRNYVLEVGEIYSDTDKADATYKELKIE